MADDLAVLREPCFWRSTVGVINGKRWSFIIDYLGTFGIATPDESAVAQGWDDGLFAGPPDATPILSAALLAKTRKVDASALLDFMPDVCATCGDTRRVECVPCDECEGDGWSHCLCTLSKNDGTLPASGFTPRSTRHYNRRLIAIVLRAMPTVDEYFIGECAQSKTLRALVIRANDHVAIVMEIKTRDDNRAPFPKFMRTA